MVDVIDQLGDLAVDYARIKGARASLRLNAWPVEIPIATAADFQGGPPGLLQGQVIVRDSAGRVMTTIGRDVRQNWILTGAIMAGLGALLFIIVRGIAPKKRG